MARKKRIEMVEDWQSCWRWISIICMTVSGAINLAWYALADDFKKSISPDWLAKIALITFLLMVVGILGRLIKQGGKK